MGNWACGEVGRWRSGAVGKRNAAASIIRNTYQAYRTQIDGKKRELQKVFCTYTKLNATFCADINGMFLLLYADSSAVSALLLLEGDGLQSGMTDRVICNCFNILL